MLGPHGSFLLTPAVQLWEKQNDTRWVFDHHGFRAGNVTRIGNDGTGHIAVTGSIYYVALPDWVVVILLGILPFLTGARIRHRKQQQSRLQRGLCTACGYDLRATPDRCPECGTVPNG
jgi:hypothetical protein